ncbi:hypothetical protein BDV59DRAFT_186739 [Aspergillus ambiguus]|uniref:uncharacterized protein n=1 Tax=Aspergillus ambiguus TaxID=176160 RepID=UPI003CCD131E
MELLELRKDCGSEVMEPCERSSKRRGGAGSIPGVVVYSILFLDPRSIYIVQSKYLVGRSMERFNVRCDGCAGVYRIM